MVDVFFWGIWVVLIREGHGGRRGSEIYRIGVGLRPTPPGWKCRVRSGRRVLIVPTKAPRFALP